MNNREFVDKQVRFSDPAEGKFYVFYSSVPDSNEIYMKEKIPPKTDRAYTIIGV